MFEKIFTKNLGTPDRTLRVILGVALISYGIFAMGTWGVILAVVGLVPLATGVMGSCPLYTVFKLNTIEGKPCFWKEGLKH
jgi:uncharacterized membrane protein